MTVDVFFVGHSRQLYLPSLHGRGRASGVVALTSLLLSRPQAWTSGSRFAQPYGKIFGEADRCGREGTAFGEGLNTISSFKALFRLIAVSLLMWFMIALAYREVAHSYPPEPLSAQQGPPFVDVETARLADMPESAGQPLTQDTIAALSAALHSKGYSLRTFKGDIWLFRQKQKIEGRRSSAPPTWSAARAPSRDSAWSLHRSVTRRRRRKPIAVISALQVVYASCRKLP
jgi:hypothetical protein